MSSINFAENLKRLREAKNMTKAELARRIGVSDVTLGHWEIGKISPRMGKVELIASVLGVTTDDLLFESQSNPQVETPVSVIPVKGQSKQVPLYGSIAAGIPLEMIQIDDYIEIPEYIFERHPHAFLLRVNGDSMNKVVPNGAYALVEPCEEIANGEIAAVTVNGFDATLKRLYKLQNTLVLEPDSYNPEHSAKTFDLNNDQSDLIKVIGKMVWYMSPFNVKY